MQLSAFFEALDQDDDNLISRREFLSVVTQELGYTGGPSVLAQVFAEIDDDSTGQISFDELSSWLRGQDTAKATRLKNIPKLVLKVDEEDSEDPSSGAAAADEPWSLEDFRQALLRMLEAYDVHIVDLIEDLDANDKDGGMELWTANAEGQPTMKGTATW